MTSYAAFLRGINVGGNSTISMKDLAALCTEIGFKKVRTHINSGNVLFESNAKEASLTEKLEAALEEHMKKQILVCIRTEKELESILAKNPFKREEGSRVGVLLFPAKIPTSFRRELTMTGPEKIQVAVREAYIFYPDGMGKSKLKLPKLADTATMRNVNTIEKVLSLTQAAQEA